ncbi:MAG: methyltransferase domain-containing protein [Microbacterium aurum]
MVSDDWQRIAADYEAVRASGVSLDALIEWPAQQRVVGDVTGLDVLDLGCGSGEKAVWFAHQGARRVVGIDIVDAFISIPEGLDVELRVGDLNGVGKVIGDERFDVAIVFQAIGYAADESALLTDVWDVLRPGGTLVVARSHPLRFAVERSKAEGVPLAAAYRADTPFTYPATWGSGTVTHRTFTFGQTVQPALDAGFVLERIDEPAPTDELRRISPDRAAWMDEHAGIIIYRFRKPR